jgi:hypothetical protein
MADKNIEQTKSAGKVAKKKTEAKKEIKKVVKKVAKKSEKKSKVQKQEGGEETLGKRNRSFKVIYADPNGDVVMEGRYCGAKPKQAACKALTGIYKIFKEEGQDLMNDIRFGVYETTRGSKNKRYWYTGKKEELEQPIQLYLLPNTDGVLTLLKKWESEKEKKMTSEEKEKLENKKKNKKSNKRYCSAETVEEMGGFKKVFGKEQKDVKPSIIYNFTNEITKVSKDKCEHLMNVQNVDDDNNDNEETTQKAGSEKKQSKKLEKEEKSDEKVEKKKKSSKSDKKKVAVKEDSKDKSEEKQKVEKKDKSEEKQKVEKKEKSKKK